MAKNVDQSAKICSNMFVENTVQDIERLKLELQSCQKTLTALGDETRQHLLFIMLDSECSGSRVVDISRRTNLSRLAGIASYADTQRCRDCKIKKGRNLYLLLPGPTGQRD